ncbi:MAG: hypothetical protein ACXVEF_01140 [Polyangiales bacterium]
MKKKEQLVAAALTAGLAYWSIGAIREKTGGSACAPLDDAFIHFQYARSFAEGHPLVYAAGDPPTSGATSLLWSFALAIPWKLGLRDVSLVWAAWAIGFTCLALLALETRRLASRILPRGMADLAGLAALLFGGHLWCAGSAMEVIPFAWVMMRTARLASELMEGDEPGESPKPEKFWDRVLSDEIDHPEKRPSPIELAIFGALAPLLRPEGVLVALLAAVVLFLRERKRTWIPLLGVVTPPLVYWLATGRAAASTTQVKWLLASPYKGTLGKTLLLNVEILFTQLLDGKGPAKTFIPEGIGFLFLLAPIALLFAAERRQRKFRAFAVLVVAFGILLPTTYETFLANRLRYLWPFTAAWAIGLVAVVDAIAVLAMRFDPKLKSLRGVGSAVFLLALVTKASESIEDLAVSAAGVHAQQVSLARWASGALPPNALVGVNDAGALAYLSGKRTFDIVGLTTRNEARYWVNGAGSRFEHYERLAREGKPLPTHFVVYPQWWEIGPLLGPELAQRTVEGASVLGAPQMIAAEAKWALLGSGEQPTSGGNVIDALDVADLESEAEHAYELGDAKRSEDALVLAEQRLDGGRIERSLDRFELRMAPGGRLVMRLGTTAPLSFVTVTVDSAPVKSMELSDTWQELSLEVPRSLTEGRHRVEIAAAQGQRFVSLHHWSIGP